MNPHILRSELAIREMNIASLASTLSISKAALYRKMSGRSEFTRLEILKVIKALGLPESRVMDIFFDNKVS